MACIAPDILNRCRKSSITLANAIAQFDPRSCSKPIKRDRNFQVPIPKQCAVISSKGICVVDVQESKVKLTLCSAKALTIHGRSLLYWAKISLPAVRRDIILAVEFQYWRSCSKLSLSTTEREAFELTIHRDISSRNFLLSNLSWTRQLVTETAGLKGVVLVELCLTTSSCCRCWYCSSKFVGRFRQWFWRKWRNCRLDVVDFAA